MRVRTLAFSVSLLVAPFVIMSGQYGKMPTSPDVRLEVKLELKQAASDGNLSQVDGVVTVRNLGNEALTVQSLSNRLAVTFAVLDSRGNVVSPIGRAKVDPKFEKKSLSPGSKLIEVFEGLKFISGTGQFGYDLRKGERYTVVAIYRPGGQEKGICSRETTIDLR